MQKLKENIVGADAHIDQKNKGITLIALIITIIVMLILVAVTVNVALNGGLFDTAKEATDKHELEATKENLLGYALEYYQKTGDELPDEAITELAKTIIETEMDANKFILYYDKKAANLNKKNEGTEGYVKIPESYVFYNWKTCTDEDVKKLEEKYSKTNEEGSTVYNLYNKYFIADINGDGYCNEDDIEDFGNYINGEYTYNMPFYVGELNRDRTRDAADVMILRNLVSASDGFTFQSIMKEMTSYYKK